MLKTLLGATGSIRYVGSVTAVRDQSANWNASGEAIDVLSVAEVGDLVIIAIGIGGTPTATWSWVGMEFTDILDDTLDAGYVGYRVIQAGDANPYLSITDGAWFSIAIVASVFRAASYVSSATDAGAGTLPTPPALTAAGKLWVVAGGLDADSEVGTWGMPTGYTQAGFIKHESGIHDSAAAIAYKLESASSDTPSAFTGIVTGDWLATTTALS